MCILKPEGRDYKILVVDDDEKIRSIFATLLRFKGHHVITASNGQEAIKIIKKHKNINLVVTDLEMPFMNGDELIKKAKKINPRLKSIVVSGRSKTKEEIPATRILLKPIGIEDFNQAVKQVFAASAC